jgi:hypothetical protein
MARFDRDNTHTFDGLVVGYGTRKEQTNTLVKVSDNGVVTTAKMVIDWDGLEDTDSVTVASISENSILIPRGSLIKEAIFQVHVAFVGASGTLDIGTYAVDATEDDADGIDVDIAETAIDAIGDIIRCNGALVGTTAGTSDSVVPVGATADADCVIVAAYQTTAFTAGRGILTVEYVVPSMGNRVLAV